MISSKQLYLIAYVKNQVIHHFVNIDHSTAIYISQLAVRYLIIGVKACSLNYFQQPLFYSLHTKEVLTCSQHTTLVFLLQTSINIMSL